MADLAVLYDPQLELAALVDVDEGRALGPVGIGPDSQQQLTAFVDATMPAFLESDSTTLIRAWVQFWQSRYNPAGQVAEQGAVGPVESTGHTDVHDAALAAAEAVAAGAQPPAPGPADADMEADQGTPPVAVTNPEPLGADPNAASEAVTPPRGPCIACDGKGQVPGPTQGVTVTCNLCKGTGQMPVTVPA